MLSKKIAAGFAAVAALSLPIVFAAPAAAATLPAGDSLFAISCDYNSPTGPDFAGLYSVDPANAAGTLIGSGTGIVGDCAGQAAYNPVTGESFYSSWPQGGDEFLRRIDVTTGVSTTVGEWGGAAAGNGDALAIGKDGTAYVTSGSQLHRVNLADATTTLVGPLGVSQLWAFAVDPVSGLFYAIQPSGDAYRIDVATGAATAIGSIDGGDGMGGIYSMQIDTSGIWWVEADIEDASEIYTGPQPSALDTPFTLVGEFDDAPELQPYTESLLLTYPKALAATGVDATAFVAAGAAAALLALAGGTLLVVRRRRTV